MKEIDDSLDLLDLDDEAGIDSLPETSPFASPRPKKPWLLLGVGLLVIILATYIIIRAIGTDTGSSIDIDLDTPEVVTINPDAGPSDTLVVPPVAAPQQPTHLAPIAEPQTPGVPVRVVSDRQDVTFNPDKPVTTKPVQPAAKPVTKPAVKPKTSVAAGGWYVQFGSYSTRALAEGAQKNIQSRHASLFSGKQFVILAAVLPNGTTTYRLRVAFAGSNDANGFCRNAKSDGLDCYVAK